GNAADLRRSGADRRRVLRPAGARCGNVGSRGRWGMKDLVKRAREAMRHAWAPYSSFHVGAAIEAADGKVYVGCNVESASYGLTICAERMALGAAVVGGARQLEGVVVQPD